MPGFRPQTKARPAAFRVGCSALALLFVFLGSALVTNRHSPPPPADRNEWRVARVNDGDTVTCIDDRKESRRIRLKNIDAPELAQPDGQASRAALQEKLSGGRVRVEGEDIDQYGRLLGTLWIGERNINLEMVSDGWAWEFSGRVPDRRIVEAESAARAGRRGLWAGSSPQRPSQWRKAHPRED